MSISIKNIWMFGYFFGKSVPSVCEGRYFLFYVNWEMSSPPFRIIGFINEGTLGHTFIMSLDQLCLKPNIISTFSKDLFFFTCLLFVYLTKYIFWIIFLCLKVCSLSQFFHKAVKIYSSRFWSHSIVASSSAVYPKLGEISEPQRMLLRILNPSPKLFDLFLKFWKSVSLSESKFYCSLVVP